jgi:hypothetical protein
MTQMLDRQRAGGCRADIKHRILYLIHSLHTNHVDQDGHICTVLCNCPDVDLFVCL